MHMKSLQLLAPMALAAAMLSSPLARGADYWSPVSLPPPDCSSLAGESPVAITNPAGATVGYSCYVSGTFAWLAAGGGWRSSIRVAAPASAPIGVAYKFYDTSGSDLTLDVTVGVDASVRAAAGVNFALSANQPSEVRLLGPASGAPQYSAGSAGSVYAVFYCPDAATCANVLPQVIYSTQPTLTWLLGAPIAWDTELWTQWSAEGIDDGGARRVALAICNEDTTATSYTVRVYDSTGSLAGTGTTPVIPPLEPLPDGSLGQGGTYGALLADVISTPLPAGVFKILVDGGPAYSAVEMLQFDGPSAVGLQVVYDSAPGSRSMLRAASRRRASMRTARVASMARPVFSPLEK